MCAITSSQSRKLFSILLSEITWCQPKVNIFGQKSPIPRLSAWHGDNSYTYSGIKMVPALWTSTLTLLKDKAESVTGRIYNSVLLNFYRDGHDSIAWHSDNEPELGPTPSIASITLGDERKFEFRHKKNFKKKISISLPDGSLLFMGRETQKIGSIGFQKLRDKYCQ